MTRERRAQGSECKELMQGKRFWGTSPYEEYSSTAEKKGRWAASVKAWATYLRRPQPMRHDRLNTGATGAEMAVTHSTTPFTNTDMREPSLRTQTARSKHSIPTAGQHIETGGTIA